MRHRRCPTKTKPHTYRLTDAEHAWIEELKAFLGLESSTEVLSLALCFARSVWREKTEATAIMKKIVRRLVKKNGLDRRFGHQEVPLPLTNYD